MAESASWAQGQQIILFLLWGSDTTSRFSSHVSLSSLLVFMSQSGVTIHPTGSDPTQPSELRLVCLYRFLLSAARNVPALEQVSAASFPT